ncbi:MAG: hypothetical protein NTW07_12595 [candidate division Zixibacteria bacterium]|nr:hypothetical protein [candidate division Zixibacteria bacterium]
MTRKRKILSAFVGLLIAAAASVSAGDKPAMEVNWYGTLRLDGSWDQNPTSHGNYVMWVSPQSLEKDDAQLNVTHRASRIGFRAKNAEKQEVTIGGNVEVDMYGGGSENKALLLLRHAYFTVQSGQFKLLAGQSWDLIAPLNPATLNYSVLWGGGNTGYRRPQVSLFYYLTNSQITKVELAVGAFRTIEGDLTPTFSLADRETADGQDDGTDAAIPSFQGRLDVTHQFVSGTSVRGGVSGLWGRLKSETNMGHGETYKSWAACAHLMVSLANGLGLSGEAFTGSNLGSYLGSIADSSHIDGLPTVGGWASAWFKPHKKITLTAGYGADNPDNEVLSAGSRSFNRAIFGNVKYTIVAPVTIGLELTQWETRYIDAATAKALRIETSFMMDF